MTHPFDISPLDRFAGASAAVKRPQEIAYFSFDDDHKFRLDGSSLRYYYPPSLPCSLRAGFDQFRQLDDSKDEHLDALLTTIMEKEKETGERVSPDVVTWRGMITKIMVAPYDYFKEGFEMNATLFQDTIWIEEHKAFKEQKKGQEPEQRPNGGAPSNDEFAYMGYKFETISVLPAPWDAMTRDQIEARDRDVVSNHAQYCSVVRTGIGQSSLVLGGEVDAVWDRKPDDPEQPINWVELKTAQKFAPGYFKDAVKWERKLLKFWAQSFLLGVPKIVVGFRTRNGELQELRELDTHRIPSMVKNGRAEWDHKTCISFTAGFLDHLKSTIKADGADADGSVWRIRRPKGGSHLEVFKLDSTDQPRILSDEFVQWRRQGEGEGEGEQVAAAEQPAEPAAATA